MVRVVSPGTLTDSGYLDAREPAFLMGIAPVPKGTGYGIALLDLSTGEFTATEYLGAGARQTLADELAAIDPAFDRFRALEEAAASLGAGRWSMLTEVLLPGALPNIVTGIRTGLGFAWRGLIAAGSATTWRSAAARPSRSSRSSMTFLNSVM